MPSTTIKALEERLERELNVRDAKIKELQDDLESLNASSNKKITSLEERVNDLEIANAVNVFVRNLRSSLIDDQNQYSRKTNLIIDGLRIGEKDGDEKILKLVLEKIENLTLISIHRTLTGLTVPEGRILIKKVFAIHP